ncbi:MAG TPA: hypothetical protein VIJ24_02175, partial [Verrucomicrobiae bacterium]
MERPPAITNTTVAIPVKQKRLRHVIMTERYRVVGQFASGKMRIPKQFDSRAIQRAKHGTHRCKFDVRVHA